MGAPDVPLHYRPKTDKKLRQTIAGPYKYAETALAVEAALLSFCQQSPHFSFGSENKLPEGNKNGGENRFRLHPIYVPAKFTERLGRKPITEGQLNDLFAKAGGRPLFVFIGPDDKTFHDSERKCDPGEPPSDEAVRERIRQYWPLQAEMKRAERSGDGFPNV